MSEIGGVFPIPAGRAGTFPQAGGGRLGGIIGIIQNLDAAREAYLERMAEMEKVKAEAQALTKELSEEGCDQCTYTKGQVTLQNIEGWSEVSVAYQFYICQFPINFQIMKIMEWTYGVAFDGFMPKECLLKESKANYDQFFAKDGLLKFFMAIKHGDDGLFLEQAQRQNVVAAKGMPPGKLEWYFMQPVSAKYAKAQFLEQGLRIQVIHKPMPVEYVKSVFQNSRKG